MHAIRHPFKALGRAPNSTGGGIKPSCTKAASIWLLRRCSGPTTSGLTHTIKTPSARVQTITVVLAMGAGGTAEMILGILTYSDSWLHSSINYTTLAVSLWPVLCQHNHACRSNNDGITRASTIRTKWAAFLVFLFAFQVLLCIAEGCVSISVVWSAVVGILWTERALLRANQEPPPPGYDKHLAATGAAVVGVMAFYMMTEEPLTTIAHVCAVILGCGIAMVLPAAAGLLELARRDQRRQRTDEAAPSASQDPLLPPNRDPPSSSSE